MCSLVRLLFFTFVEKDNISGSTDMNSSIDITYLTLACMCCGVAIVGSFMPRRATSLVAYCAMIFATMSGAASFGVYTYIFWGIAVLITIGINYMLPREVACSRAGLPFIAGGSLTGTAVGMATATSAGIISGAALGAFFGALAFANTPGGRAMTFPSAKFFNYLAAKGLPVIVTLSLAGIILTLILAR